MSDTVLLIFEGVKTEHHIFNSLKQHFFSQQSVVVSFGAEIYQLWQQLSEDSYLDLFEVLKERSDLNRAELAAFNRDSFSQIFLFFDYDCHATHASDDKIKNMLQLFDNETENGKLYISYPMVEAIKHFPKDVDFKNVTVAPKIGAAYKQLAATSSLYPDFRKIMQDDWKNIILQHLIKANYIVHNSHAMPKYSDRGNLGQLNIFEAQLNSYVNPKQLLAVLSAFPFLVIEYFDENTFNELTNPDLPARYLMGK